MSVFLPFAQTFQAALKAFQMYGPPHPRTTAALESAEGALGALFTDGKGCRIAITGGRLYFGKERQNSQNLHISALLRQLEDRQINGFSFSPGVTPEELQSLVYLLALKPAKILEEGGPEKILEARGTQNIKILQSRLEEVGEGEDLISMQGAAQLMEQVAALGTMVGTGNGEGAGAAGESGAAGSGAADSGVAGTGAENGGAAPESPQVPQALRHAGLLKGFLAGLARGGMAAADLGGLASFLGEIGMEPGSPQVGEMLFGAIQSLPPDQQVGVLRSINSLVSGPLKQAMTQIAPSFMEVSLGGAFAQGHTATGPLAQATQDILPLSANPRNALQKALDSMRQQGMSEEQIQELTEIVTWDSQPFEDRIEKLLEGQKIFEMPLEKVLSLMRELLEGGRNQDFLKLMKHFASGLHNPAVARRAHVAEGFEQIASWVDMPGMPEPLVEVLLETLRIHYGREKDPQVHSWTAKSVENLLWHWAQNGDPNRAEREWEALTDTVTELSLPAPWKAQATADLLARLGNPERLSKMLSLLFHADRETAAREIHPFLIMLGATSARYLAQSLAEEQDRTRRGRLLEALKAMGAAAVGPLQESLDATEWYIVRNALNVLGEIGTQELAGDLAKVLQHTDPRVVRAAISALWKMGGRQSESLITAQLRHPDADTQMEALFCLGEMKAKNSAIAIAELTKPPKLLMGGTPQRVRERAIETLGRLGTPFALDIFAELLKRKGFFGGSTEPFEIRAAAARGLKLFGTGEAIEILSKAVQDEPKGAERRALETILGAHS